MSADATPNSVHPRYDPAAHAQPAVPAPGNRHLGAASNGASLLLDEATLQLLIESVPVAIVAVDEDGRIVYANQKLNELFGYPAGELIGASLEQLMPERFRDRHVAYRTGYVEQPHVRPMGSGMDLAGRRKDGQEFPIEAGLSHVRIDNRVISLSSIVDISRRKHAEEMLEQRVVERTREIERRRRVADSLRDILGLLNSSQPLQDVLDHISVQASHLLNADAAAIYRLEHGREPLEVMASHGLPAIFCADNHRLLLATLPAASSADDQALLTVETLPPAPHPDIVNAHSDLNRHYQAQLAIPLVAHDEVFGGLMLYYREPRRYSAEEIELAVTFGAQVKLAIENDRLRAQSAQSAVAAERNRIARDLHDSVSQTLFSASLIAEVLPRLQERDLEESRRRLDELRTLTRGALAEMRSLLLELRPSALMEVEISELLRQLVEAAAARARIPVRLQIDGDMPVPQDVKIAFYHITQEALNNVIKHARATSASVTLLRRSHSLELTVRDDGLGFVLGKVTPEHLGLTIMQERAEDVGAHLRINTAPDQGTIIDLRWLFAHD